MAIAMTDQQREEPNDKGYFIVENVLSADRVETISRAIDAVVERVRPSGHIEQDPELIARSSPVRRQLLGGLGDLSDPLGKDPASNPSSHYWFTDDWNSVPLKAWAEERASSNDCEWGPGFDVSHTKGPGFEFTQRRMPLARDGRGE